MLSLANIYTFYFRLYFRLCICLNKLSINQYIANVLLKNRNKSNIVSMNISSLIFESLDFLTYLVP